MGTTSLYHRQGGVAAANPSRRVPQRQEAQQQKWAPQGRKADEAVKTFASTRFGLEARPVYSMDPNLFSNYYKETRAKIKFALGPVQLFDYTVENVHSVAPMIWASCTGPDTRPIFTMIDVDKVGAFENF